MSQIYTDIADAKQAVEATLDSQPFKAKLLSNLGTLLADRYSEKGMMEDLEEAIRVTKQAVDISKPDYPDTAAFYSNLGALLGYRYAKTRLPDDFEEALQAARHSVEATRITDPERAGRLSNLGLRLGDLYSKTRDEGHLEEAIRITREALEAMPGNHRALPMSLNSLALQLGERYRRTNDIADLDETIQLTRQAVKNTSDKDPHKVGRLQNLGLWLGSRHSRTGSMGDLEESIQVLEQAITATLDRDPKRSLRLNSLAIRLYSRYIATGAIDDLDKGIQVTKESILRTPDSDPEKMKWLNNLSTLLGERYSRVGAIDCLNDAIQAIRKALGLRGTYHPQDPKHPDIGSCLNNLGLRLRQRYLRTGEVADLQEAIRVTREAVEVADTPAAKAMSLTNLGHLLGSRYLEAKATTDQAATDQAASDLEESIQVTRDAIEFTPDGHPDRAGRLYNLSLQLGHRYASKGMPEDLQDAINAIKKAISATPANHPDLARLSHNLGNFLIDRNTSNDIEEAICCYESALGQKNSPAITRIQAGAAILQNSSDWEKAYEAASLAVGLVPKLTSRSLENSDKPHALRQVVGLASDSAAAALRAKRSPLDALRLLELGRGILGTSLEDMRADIFELSEAHPRLAERFTSLRDELDAPIAEMSLMDHDKSLVEADISRRYEAGKEFEELIDKIRHLPGFNDFLAPPTELEMKSAAEQGPIIIVNVSKYRCDALVVQKDNIWSLELDLLTKTEIENRAMEDNLGSDKILKWLWRTVANPVLQALGLTQSPSSDNWPRIWWISTGPLSKFPLHAAGNHSSSETVLDRAMSSYGSSIKNIIHARRAYLPKPSTPSRALLVAMPETHEYSTLYHVTNEVNKIEKLCESMELIKPQPYKREVISRLLDCDIFHFAGHGYSDSSDPLKSRLCLRDWKEHPLEVADLLEINLRQRSPLLAYLSACGTGQLNDKTLVDESIHLISACQLAGFRHVIGTLWGVEDETCVEMASITYEDMLRGQMSDEAVCRGLHKASRHIRDRWQPKGAEKKQEEPSIKDLTPSLGGFASLSIARGEGLTNKTESRDATLLLGGCDEKAENPLPWVPYVHFGV